VVSRRVQRVALVVAALHLLGVIVTAIYINASTEGQAPFVWIYWAFVDLPWSLAYLLAGPVYAHWFEAHTGGHPLAAQFLYFPYLLHGIVGTIWWYFLVVIVGKLIDRFRGRRSRPNAERRMHEG
jgi:hypothetical protein